MNSSRETGTETITAELQMECAVLADCMRSYERLIGSLRNDPTLPVLPPDRSERSAAIAKIEMLTRLMRQAAISTADSGRPFVGASPRSTSRPSQLIMYFVVVLAIGAAVVGGWWIYRRPVQLASERLQGCWQQYDLTDVGETGRQYYRTVEGNELSTSSYIPYDDKWHTYGRTFDLVPARGFFELKISGMRGERPVAGADFYVQITGDKIYELRGIHRLDPMHATEINLWRHVDALPAAAASKR